MDEPEFVLARNGVDCPLVANGQARSEHGAHGTGARETDEEKRRRGCNHHPQRGLDLCRHLQITRLDLIERIYGTYTQHRHIATLIMARRTLWTAC